MALRRVRRPPRGGSDPPAGADADPAAARAAAVGLLARRDYAAAELRERLCTRGFGVEAAAAAVGELATQGVVNDERYAQNYVAYHAGRGRGPIRLGADLRALGVAAALVAAALESGPDWTAHARQVRARRFGRQPPQSWAEKARQGRFLQYRGFSADHIRAATGADPDTD